MKLALVLTIFGVLLIVNCQGKKVDCKKEKAKKFEKLPCSAMAKSAHKSNCFTSHTCQDICKCTCDAVKKGDEPTFGPEEKTTKKPKKTTKKPKTTTTSAETTETPEETTTELPEETTEAPVQQLGGCFSGDTLIQTRTGLIPIEQLAGQTGVDVMTLDTKTGSQAWEPIQMWIHSEPEKRATFNRITLSIGATLEASDKHLAYTVNCQTGDYLDYKFSSQLAVEDCMKVVDADEGCLVTATIQTIERVERTGIYTFLTATGTVMANGIVMSCHSDWLDQNIAKFYYQAMAYAQSLLPDTIVGSLYTLLYGSGSTVALGKFIEAFSQTGQFFMGQK